MEESLLVIVRNEARVTGSSVFVISAVRGAGALELFGTQQCLQVKRAQNDSQSLYQDYETRLTILAHGTTGIISPKSPSRSLPEPTKGNMAQACIGAKMGLCDNIA